MEMLIILTTILHSSLRFKSLILFLDRPSLFFYLFLTFHLYMVRPTIKFYKLISCLFWVARIYSLRASYLATILVENGVFFQLN